MSPLQPRMIPAVQATKRHSRGQEGRFRPRRRLVIPPFHSPVLGYGLVADQAHSKGPFRPSAVALLRSRIPKIGTAPSAFGPAGPRALGSHLASSSGPIHGTPHARSRAPRVSSALLPAVASRCAPAAVQGPHALSGREALALVARISSALARSVHDVRGLTDRPILPEMGRVLSYFPNGHKEALCNGFTNGQVDLSGCEVGSEHPCSYSWPGLIAFLLIQSVSKSSPKLSSRRVSQNSNCRAKQLTRALRL